jgi:hypothetical protein
MILLIQLRLYYFGGLGIAAFGAIDKVNVAIVKVTYVARHYRFAAYMQTVT